MSTLADRYAKAISSSNLRVEAHINGDADVLIASGWAGSGSSLASLIHRTRAEFDRHADASSKMQGSALASARSALQSFTTRQAAVLKIDMGPDALAKLSDSILDVILQPACPTCSGVAYSLIANTSRLSASACPTCSGTGKRVVRCEDEGSAELARKVSSSIATKLDLHAAKLRKYLRRS